MSGSSTERRRSVSLLRAAALAVAPSILAGGYALAQRPGLITGITEESSAPSLTFYITWDAVAAKDYFNGGLDTTEAIYQSEDTTNDNDAEPCPNGPFELNSPW